MQVTGKIVVVTGGANGIGRALCEAFHRAGAAKVIVADLDFAGCSDIGAGADGRMIVNRRDCPSRRAWRSGEASVCAGQPEAAAAFIGQRD